MTIGLLLLRLAVGMTLMAHGFQKLRALDHAAPMFEQLGFVPGKRNALLAGVAETGAGILLALGFLTPLGAAMAFGVMLVAGGTAHWKRGFFAQNGGYEYNVILAAASLALAFTGPGPASLDAAFGLDLAGPRWGLAALVIGLLGSAFELVTRQRHLAHQNASGANAS
jgi:putative oxidoreductase